MTCHRRPSARSCRHRLPEGSDADEGAFRNGRRSSQSRGKPRALRARRRILHRAAHGRLAPLRRTHGFHAASRSRSVTPAPQNGHASRLHLPSGRPSPGRAPLSRPESRSLKPMPGQFLSVARVSVRYGESTILDEVSLDIEEGEFVALLGASGCGKTTLLRAISGFAPVADGEIRIGGRDVTGTPPERRNTAMVFQSYALWPHMSAADNIGYGLKLRRVAAPQRRERVEHVLALLGLAGLGRRRISQLSGGQRQRVALGRALAIDPTILLLDEPLSNLDARIRQTVRHEIKSLQESPRYHHRARHPRPRGSDGDGRPHRHHERGSNRAGRRPRSRLQPAGFRVRRRLHGGRQRGTAHGWARERRLSRLRLGRTTTRPCCPSRDPARTTVLASRQPAVAPQSHTSGPRRPA